MVPGGTGAHQVTQADADAAAMVQATGADVVFPSTTAAPGATSVAAAVVIIYQAFFGS